MPIQNSKISINIFSTNWAHLTLKTIPNVKDIVIIAKKPHYKNIIGLMSKASQRSCLLLAVLFS